ncbi:hypothetical protein [Agromyces lapidis]|uniref:DNA topoisomerase (ATP-hydrolyzing) n=1 Tax=Agromyces lapidis TaxID=279574 RepID=A0ABV5SM85_9MICO|nr:hypothetical protein [Agromyces lapidis]
MDRRDLPQIGPLEVEPEAIEAHGEPLDGLLARLGAVVPDAQLSTGASGGAAVARGETPPMPGEGWRVLHTDRAVVLGAPIDDARRFWRLASLQQPSSQRPSSQQPNARFDLHPDRHPLRPSRAERGRGLVLRWPGVTTSAPDVDSLWIDIVNEGDAPWVPNGDGFHVAAAVVRPDRDRGVYFGFVAGHDGAFPLDPGEYGRVRAHFDQSSLDGLEPGEVEVHAWLIDLSIRTSEPLLVRVEPETIERRRNAVLDARPGPSRDAAEQTRTRIALLRTLVGAREMLPELIDALDGPGDREQGIARIAEVLGCTPDEARGVAAMPLARFGRAQRESMSAELRELEQVLGKLEERDR